MVTPVVYHQGLTLNEVERRYEEVKEEFETIKKNYSAHNYCFCFVCHFC